VRRRHGARFHCACSINQQSRVALGSPVGLRRHRLGDQAVAVLDQQVAQIRQPRLGAVRFPIQFRVGIGGRRMRVILPLLATKALAVPVALAVFPLKTLLAGSRFDQRAIDGEVLIGHQALGTLDDTAEEAPATS
jgi:hypothetical protein